MSRKRQQQWIEGGFFDNLAAAADAVGFENVDVAWGLARVRWQSVNDRERFLGILTGVPSREVAGGNVNG